MAKNTYAGKIDCSGTQEVKAICKSKDNKKPQAVLAKKGGDLRSGKKVKEGK